MGGGRLLPIDDLDSVAGLELVDCATRPRVPEGGEERGHGGALCVDVVLETFHN